MDDTCDLICVSHRPWDSVDRDALIRAAAARRVFFVEEPVFEPGPPFLSTRRSPEGVMIVQAGLPAGTGTAEVPALVHELIARLMEEEDIGYCAVWFDSPRAPWFSDQLAPAILVEDLEDVGFGAAWTAPAAQRS